MSSSTQKSPLRWFLLLWLGLVYLDNLQAAVQKLAGGFKVPPTTGGSSAQLDLVAFTLLMVVQGVLHWVTFSIHRTRVFLLFAVAQGALVLLTVFLAHADNAIFGLCLALTVETITLCKHMRVVLPLGIGYLLLFGVTEGAQFLPLITSGSVTKLSGALLDSLTLILFVIACVMLYIQQSRAHQRDQTLLHELESAHAELKVAHVQLAEYAEQVEDLTLITERQRLARELHDTLAQGLVGLTMQLETIDALLLKQHGEQARAIVQQAMTRARATMTEVRHAIEDLRADWWEDLTFSQAAQHEIQRFTSVTGIPCICSLPETLPIPTAAHEHLVRLVAESLLNIARHAQATRAWVCAVSELGLFALEIGDDGIGFDHEVAASQGGHFGLLGMRERARLLHGQLLILSAPGKGTTIRLQVPVPATEGGQDYEC
jgi:NarL family two-component system sensor histidine kinase YdfH